MTPESAANFDGLVLDDCVTCRGPVVRAAAAAYCPRCGTTVRPGGGDEPMLIQTPARRLHVGARIGSGDAARLYACQVSPARTQTTSHRPPTAHVFKVAATSASNEAMKNEAATLHLLAFSSGFEAFQPFVPRVIESFVYVDETREARQVNVLAYDNAIESPRELYSLVDVRAAYSHGIDARDAAWIFRRLLHVLAAAHDRGVAHNAVTPTHVLIEPTGHKLVLVGWSHAGGVGQKPHPTTVDALARAWRKGFDVSSLTGRAADLSLAARTAIYLVGGDWLTLSVPETVEPAIARFLERCAAGTDVAAAGQADRLLKDFDRLIESAWGSRKFRPFAMPARVS